MNSKFKLILFIIFFSKINSKLNILHISFHKGCINEIESIANELSLNLSSLFIPDLLPNSFDNEGKGNNLYNICKERANRIWEKNKDYFNSFDVIITSDTTPLSRIFLENDFNKFLIVWICNRFDYYDAESLDCKFPDEEYYDLLKKSAKKNKVIFAFYSKFEKYYAETKGINLGNLIINPIGLYNKKNNFSSFIPPSINKNNCFFIPKYHNNTLFLDLQKKCKELSINAYCGSFNGPQDLKEFKGIINLPGAWSNFILFENIQNIIPIFVPSIQFLFSLKKIGNYFIPNANYFFDLKQHNLSDWYSKKFEAIITYFDSWQDLKNKINNTNYEALKAKIKIYAQKHRLNMLKKWKNIFDAIEKSIVKKGK